MKKFLNRKPAAAQMSISVRQLDRIIRQGRVKAFKSYDCKIIYSHYDSISEANLKFPGPVYNNFDDELK